MKKYLFISLAILCLAMQNNNLQAQTINTIAGIGPWGYNGDDIPATTAKLNDVPRIAVDACGNVYIGDSYNNRVRRVDAVTGIITTVAGTGIAGYNGDGIPATTAQLNTPTCLAFDNFGNLYIADGNNVRIRKVDAVTGIISTYVGNGTLGYSGDGVLADTSAIESGDFVFDPFGNMYMCDLFRIRKIDAAGIITTIAGTGDSGAITEGVPATSTDIGTYPAISVDKYGNVFFVDGQGSIQEVNMSTGIINRVAGTGTVGSYSGDGLVATSCTMAPTSVYVDGSGNIFSAIYPNNICIEIDTLGITHTVAGTGVEGFSGDGGLATAAKLWWPKDVIFDRFGQMYISDWENGRVRKVTYPYTATNFTDTITASTGDTVCSDVVVTYTVAIASSSGTTYSYEWYVDGSVASTVGSSYTYTPANGDSVRCVATATNACTSAIASSNTINMVVTPVTVPTITVTAPASALAGSVVDVTATVTGVGSSYSIKWYDNGLLFNTTSVPVTTYVQDTGTDVITATVIPTGETCSDTANSNAVSVSVGNEEAPSISPQGGGLSVFPNPVGDVLNIVGQDIAKVTVSNVPGQVVFTTPFPLLKTGVLRVVMAPFASGVYVVEVTDGDGVRSVVKVVKE